MNSKINTFSIWLLSLMTLICAIILIGGYTRISDSGLSITEWLPVSGILYPMSEYQWKLEFDKYKMIDEFNNGLRLSQGRKYIKVIQNGSVWGFIAVTDGVLKGITYKFGDVFKAAGWRAPAKHVRGSIYLDRTDWFHWTGPRYL